MMVQVNVTLCNNFSRHCSNLYDRYVCILSKDDWTLNTGLLYVRTSRSLQRQRNGNFPQNEILCNTEVFL